MIEMQDVSVVYPNGTPALKDISCRIEKSEFVFLVGPTGHGKSTLLKLIYRGITPTQGEVLVADAKINKLSSRQVAFLRRRIGVVFQDFRLLPQRTVWENVAFALRVTGATRKRIHREVPEVLARVGLSHKAEAFPAHISAGEQQRTAIARALVHGPAILLADEPIGNLDPESGWDIMRLLCDINALGTTVVCATHNQTVVDELRKRVIGLLEGRLVSDEAAGSYPTTNTAGKT
jgi:cell division transport system ATP-binding protein